MDPRFTPIPALTMDGLQRYVQHGVPTGSFLQAVLTNDLFGAVRLADEGNLRALVALCCYIHNDVPSACWGSHAEVRRWLELGGLEGIRRRNNQEPTEGIDNQDG